jgi:hypothetical protein
MDSDWSSLGGGSAAGNSGSFGALDDAPMAVLLAFVPDIARREPHLTRDRLSARAAGARQTTDTIHYESIKTRY